MDLEIDVSFEVRLPTRRIIFQQKAEYVTREGKRYTKSQVQKQYSDSGDWPHWVTNWTVEASDMVSRTDGFDLRVKQGVLYISEHGDVRHIFAPPWYLRVLDPEEDAALDSRKEQKEQLKVLSLPLGDDG